MLKGTEELMQGQSLRHVVLFLMMVVAAQAGCTPTFDSRSRDQDDAAAGDDVTTVEATVANGVMTANLSPSSVKSQLVAGAGAFEGAAIQFPPGSLAVDTTLTIEEGESLAASADELGVDQGGLTTASTSMLIASSAAQDPAQPFTVTLPLSGAGLLGLLQDNSANLVILYKVVMYANGGTYMVGLTPKSSLVVDGGKVTFPTSYFGVFQAVYTTTPITESKTKVVETPIINKAAQATKLSAVTFSRTDPASPAAATVFKVIGGADFSAESVDLFSDAACTKSLGSGTKGTFADPGIQVEISANSRIEIYALSRGSGRPASDCTKIGAVESDQLAPGAPTLTATSNTNDTTPTWTWTAPTGATLYRFKLDNNDLSTGATETTEKTYTPASALAEGAHTLFVQTRDAAGNWSTSGQATVTIDTTPPGLTVTSPANNEFMPSGAYSLAGTCETGLAVVVTAGTGAAAASASATCSAGTFSMPMTHTVPLPFTSVSRTHVVAQTDAAGNTTSVSAVHKHGMDTTQMRLWLNDQSFATPTAWNDLTGQGYNGTSGASFTSATINGLSVPDFVASSAFVIADTSGLTFAPDTVSLSIFVVYKLQASATGTLFAKGYGSGYGYKLAIASTLDLTLGGTTYAGAAPVPDGNPHILSIISTAGSGVVTYLDRDATDHLTDATAQGSTTGAGYDLLVGAKRVSSNSDVSGLLDDGQIAELMIFARALSANERQKIVDYLANKWNVP